MYHYVPLCTTMYHYVPLSCSVRSWCVCAYAHSYSGQDCLRGGRTHRYKSPLVTLVPNGGGGGGGDGVYSRVGIYSEFYSTSSQGQTDRQIITVTKDFKRNRSSIHRRHCCHNYIVKALLPEMSVAEI